MFTSLEVSNYRSLKRLTARKLKKINLVTGRNGAGKTSFLETVFLNAGGANASLMFSVNTFRGENVVSPDSDRYFRSLFYNQDPSQPIAINVGDTRAARQSRSRSLVIDPIWRTRTAPGRSAAARVVAGLRCVFKGPSGERTASAEWKESLTPVPLSPIMANQPESPLRIVEATDQKDLVFGQFISPYVRDVYADAMQSLQEQIRLKSMDSLLRILNIVEPSVRNIVPLSDHGQSVIYVDVQQPELLPLSSLGSGFFHILRLALAMSNIEKGLIIVDELEDGLHFSVMSKVIAAIIEHASKSDAQFFISTHSNELLQTFIEESKRARFDDLCLVNMASKGETTTVSYFDQAELDFALENQSELR